jgi:hypothetical protein
MNFAKHGYFEVIEWNYEKIKNLFPYVLTCGFFLDEFSQLGDKKKGWQIQQRDFRDLKKTICHILTKNT